MSIDILRSYVESAEASLKGVSENDRVIDAMGCAASAITYALLAVAEQLGEVKEQLADTAKQIEDGSGRLTDNLDNLEGVIAGVGDQVQFALDFPVHPAKVS